MYCKTKSPVSNKYKAYSNMALTFSRFILNYLFPRMIFQCRSYDMKSKELTRKIYANIYNPTTWSWQPASQPPYWSITSFVQPSSVVRSPCTRPGWWWLKLDFHCHIIFTCVNRVKDNLWTVCVQVESWAQFNILRLSNCSYIVSYLFTHVKNMRLWKSRLSGTVHCKMRWCKRMRWDMWP